MKIKIIIILVLIVVFFIGVAVAGYYFLWLPKHTRVKTVGSVSVIDKLLGWKFPSTVKFPSTGSLGGPIAYSSIRDPGGIPQGLPVRLQIPVIGVSSLIEDALITPDGRMDVPAGSVDVAWFSLGAQPGQVGSAVIGGHYGVNHNVPFVFYKLDQVKVGDKIYIVDDQNNTLTFVVRKIQSFDRNADATPVFTSTDGLAHLNLITCEGIWNQVNGNYPLRLVVFTDQIPSEGIAPAGTSQAPIKAPITAVVPFNRSLTIGAKGADVVALQTFLEQRGLLELPPGVTNGLFGALTRTAVAKYQASVGLPSNGLFGPLTRAKLNLEQMATKPTLPLTGTTIPNAGSKQTPQASQTLIQSVKSLFATPINALITSLLLILIAFMLFKIIKK